MVKLNSEKHVSTLKKALLTACVIVVPGGMLLGLGYLIAKRRKEKVAIGEERIEKSEAPRLP